VIRGGEDSAIAPTVVLVGVREVAQLADDLSPDVVKERERRAISQAVPDLATFLPALDDAIVVEERQMTRDVLLRRTDSSASAWTQLALEVELLDDPDAQRLAQHREALRHAVDKPIRDRVLHLHPLEAPALPRAISAKDLSIRRVLDYADRASEEAERRAHGIPPSSPPPPLSPSSSVTSDTISGWQLSIKSSPGRGGPERLPSFMVALSKP
jgi:hypothetical protein